MIMSLQFQSIRFSSPLTEKQKKTKNIQVTRKSSSQLCFDLIRDGNSDVLVSSLDMYNICSGLFIKHFLRGMHFQLPLVSEEFEFSNCSVEVTLEKLRILF